MSGTPVLATQGLTRRFGGLVAVNDVTMSVPQGQTLGVIGPNGSGKSTFINLVTGHLRPTKGSVLIDGKDLTGCNRTWMALTGTPLAGYETTRERFCGTYGGYAAPEVVVKGQCSNFLAEGDNVVGGQQADLVLGQAQLVSAGVGQGKVGDLEVDSVATISGRQRLGHDAHLLP